MKGTKMAITPADIEQLTFSEAKKSGYATDEVDAFLEQLTIEVDMMLRKIDELKNRLSGTEQQLAQSQNQVAMIQEQLGSSQAQLQAAQALIVGLVIHQPAEDILRRADGSWAYQLAVVVDDALMHVTEVVRGRDLLQSVPQQLYLYETLGYEAPRFGHLPLLCNPAGQRLSKRDQSLHMGILRQSFRAEEIIGRLAHHAGLIDRCEPVSAAELIPLFRWDKLPTADIIIAD